MDQEVVEEKEVKGRIKWSISSCQRITAVGPKVPAHPLIY